MSEIIKYDSGDVLPYKALLEEVRTKKTLELGVWLDRMLSLTGEMSTKRLEVLLPMIKDHAWNYSVKEIKEAFTAYVTGKLAIEPRENYLSVILFNKVMNLYKESIMVHRPKKDPIEKAEEHLRLYKIHQTILFFDKFVQTNELGEEASWLYDYLEYMDVLSPTKDEKLVKYKIAQERTKTQPEAITMSKLMLLKDFFARLHAKGKHIKELL